MKLVLKLHSIVKPLFWKWIQTKMCVSRQRWGEHLWVIDFIWIITLLNIETYRPVILWLFQNWIKRTQICNSEPFRDGCLYHIETSPLICRAIGLQFLCNRDFRHERAKVLLIKRLVSSVLRRRPCCDVNFSNFWKLESCYGIASPKVVYCRKWYWYSLHKKWSFPLRISSVNVTKSPVSCGFGHIYRRNP